MVFPVVGGRDPSEGYDVSRSLRYYASDQFESFTPSSASIEEHGPGQGG